MNNMQEEFTKIMNEIVVEFGPAVIGSVQLDAIVSLLIEKGLITQDEFVVRMMQVAMAFKEECTKAKQNIVVPTAKPVLKIADADGSPIIQ